MKINLLIYLSIAFFFISCHNDNSSTTEENKESEILLSPSPREQKKSSSLDTTRRIIQSGSLIIETDDVKKLYHNLSNRVTKLGGYIEQEQTSGENKSSHLFIKCRIPAKSFDYFINTIESNGTVVLSKNIVRTDVTREYIETETTINARKSLENRYIQLLGRANKISDMLEIEGKLNDIRTEIQISTNQFNSLKKQIKFSDLEITISSNQPYQDQSSSFAFKLKNSFSQGFNILKSILLGIITLWPIWLILSVSIIVYKKYRKK